MPWKAPYRANNAITQSYNDGVVSIYSVEDAARPGYQPEPELTKKVSLRYEEQRLGIQRYYSGRQNQVDIERVIRTQRVGNVNNQNVAITEDGRQYRVDLVQSVMDVWPESVDITLAKIEQEFEVP
jgi:SPP1 family predicted phage head-tail adaptor|nr:MAG TPA: hypothetical protein [Caudoviricetes sp.]